MDDIYGGGQFLRQWSIVDGWPRCPESALDLMVAEEARIGEVLAINRAVAAFADAGDAYDAAVRVLSGRAPEQWMLTTGDDGAEAWVETAEWGAWIAAGALVAAADPATELMARTRNGALDANEAPFAFALPALPPFDPRTETAVWVAGAWDVRALTESELATHPLRPAPFIPKMAFAKLVRVALGVTGGEAILGMFAGVLALAENVDWIDVFEDIDGEAAQPGYAKQLLAEEAVTQAAVTALAAVWPRACRV